MRHLEGSKMGYLTVTKRVGKASNGQALWDCTCICGKVVTRRHGNIVTAIKRDTLQSRFTQGWPLERMMLPTGKAR